MNLSQGEIKDLVKKYFLHLREKEIELFLSISEYQFANNKEVILKSGRTDKNLIFILKGVARAYSINDKGQELNDFIRAQGHLIGDAKVFGDEIQTLNIESIGELHFLKFDISELEDAGYNSPEIMKFYLNFLKEIILTLSYRLNTFVAMTSEERYLDLIKWNPLYLKTTYDKHIASFLGMTPLTLHRVKKEIKPIK